MNYYGTARTNYVSWIDLEAVVEIASKFNLIVEEKDGRHALFSTDVHGWNTYSIDSDGNEIELNIASDLAPFLQEGEVLIVQETGSEGQRYLVGTSDAYTNRGILCSTNINDIYGKALKACKRRRILDPTITIVEY